MICFSTYSKHYNNTPNLFSQFFSLYTRQAMDVDLGTPLRPHIFFSFQKNHSHYNRAQMAPQTCKTRFNQNYEMLSIRHPHFFSNLTQFKLPRSITENCFPSFKSKSCQPSSAFFPDRKPFSTQPHKAQPDFSTFKPQSFSKKLKSNHLSLKQKTNALQLLKIHLVF